MFTHATRLMLALLVALPACSMGDGSDSDARTSAADDTSGESGESGQSDGGDDPNGLDEETPADPLPDDPSAEEDPLPPALLLACDLQYPCEYPVELIRKSNTQTYAASDLCALTALASGSPGLIQTVAAFASAESYLDHVMVAPGEVLRQAHGRSDGLGLWQKPVERCVLKDAAYFAACAVSYDPGCLDPEQWVASCAAEDSLTCPKP